MNKIVWVTGTANGLGKSLASELLHSGFDVVGFVRSPPPANDMPAEGFRYEQVVLDLSDISACRRFLREEPLAATIPWLVIHNASILPSRTSLWEESWEDIERSFAVNVEAPLLFSSQLMARQIASNSGGGHLFLSSGVGRRIRSGWGSYGMSKLCIEAISQSLASDLPEPFFTATLNPGKMRTKMRQFAYPLEDPGSLPSPSRIAFDIARFVRYLHGAGGREFNGAVLEMDDIVNWKPSGRGHDGRL